eukprot:m.89021 g.89021  ORF g.89021 m.89021 type:complete len:89 (+) comp13203_c0_seq2:463-729(+)
MSHFNESLLHCPEASDMGQDYSEEDSEMATSNAYMSFSNVFLQPHTPTQTRTNTDGTDTEASTLHSGKNCHFTQRLNLLHRIQTKERL